MDKEKVVSVPMEIPFDDGTGEAIEAAAKQKEEIAKEAEKEFENRVKVADEVNNAKEVALNIKSMTEKLILDESEDSILNESVNDDLEEALPKDLANAYKHHPFTIGVGRGNKGYGNINKKHNKLGVPYRAVGDAYDRVSIDFQNSDYKQITPEEAMALKKAGQADKLRIIFDDQLVSYNAEGKPVHKASRGYGKNGHNNDSQYEHNNKIVDHTTQLPFKDVLARAQNIYVADEKDVDAEKQAERAKNPESAYFNNPDRVSTSADLVGHAMRGTDSLYYAVQDADRAKRYIQDYKRSLYNVKRKLDKLLADEKAGIPVSAYDKDQYYHDINYYKERIKEYTERAKAGTNKIKDFKAHNRFLASQVDLRQVFDNFNNLKANAKDAQRQLEYAQHEAETLKANGSTTTRDYRSQLTSYQGQLREIKRMIAKLELYLETADEDDAAEIAKANEKVTKCEDTLNSVQAQINDLLHKKQEELEPEQSQPIEEAAKVVVPFDNYEPWSGAVDTFNKIEEAGKLEELDALIDELYPEGIDETQLNDILWFENDWLFETLGIKGEEDE